jgi:hypothetical protein
MKDNWKILFKEIPWESPRAGLQQKVVEKDGQRLRLLRFTHEFHEEDWCRNGHVGYILSGSMEVDFGDCRMTYESGEGIWIEAGEAEKHRVLVALGQYTEMILFERLP